MSVTVKEKSKTPTFKIGEKVIIRFGEEPRIHRQGIILSLYQCNRHKIEYAVKFPDEKLTYFYSENRMQHIKDVVVEIIAIFKSDRLNPVSRIDCSYIKGWIECEYYRETITLEQRDELYKKYGIE